MFEKYIVESDCFIKTEFGGYRERWESDPKPIRKGVSNEDIDVLLEKIEELEALVEKWKGKMRSEEWEEDWDDDVSFEDWDEI